MIDALIESYRNDATHINELIRKKVGTSLETILEETLLDDGTILRTVYCKNKKDSCVQVRRIKKVFKEVRIKKSVYDRMQNWVKFGKAKDDNFNNSFKSTVAVKIDLKPKREIKKVKLEPKIVNDVVTCSYCNQTGHGTLKCPKRSEIIKDEWVPFHKRKENINIQVKQDDNVLILTNFDINANEEDIIDLFSPFGKIIRIYLARRWERDEDGNTTRKSKGFAFINFYRRSDAQDALETLEGHGYANYILHVKWAK